MKSTATTVSGYLKGLPADRRKELEEVRKAILLNLPPGYEEAMEGGMISYQVPLRVCPETYNGRPAQVAALASQKNHLAVYLMGAYASSAIRDRLVVGFRTAGKKLDMGKSCIRFRSAEDLSLEAIGSAIAALPLSTFAGIVTALAQTRKTSRGRPAKTPRKR